MAKGGRGKSTDPKPQSTRNQPIDYGTQPRGKPAVVVEPLTPRKKLFVFLAAVFAVWMAFLVYLYFKTVYPHRSTAPNSSTALFVGSRSAAVQSSS